MEMQVLKTDMWFWNNLVHWSIKHTFSHQSFNCSCGNMMSSWRCFQFGSKVNAWWRRKFHRTLPWTMKGFFTINLCGQTWMGLYSLVCLYSLAELGKRTYVSIWIVSSLGQGALQALFPSEVPVDLKNIHLFVVKKNQWCLVKDLNTI